MHYKQLEIDMDSITQSISELSQHFNTKLAEFQRNLDSSTQATSPTSHLAAEFNSFRTFVLTTLESLQLQVQMLSKQYDNVEMRGRRKILLLHGVPEDKKEIVSATAIKVLSDHLSLSNLSKEDLSRCHRLGSSVPGKPRAIIIKFKDLTLKNKIWFSKTKLRNTGITLSEFLTKPRHEAFMAARRRYGITKCWTKDGIVIVLDADGKRYSIASMAELNNISSMFEAQENATTSVQTVVPESKTKQVTQISRTKRTIKK